MWAPAVIKVEIAADRCAGFADVVVGSQIHLLVFDASPQTLDEHVVPPGAFAVHADGDPVPDQRAGECSAGELTALVGVEDIRLDNNRIPTGYSIRSKVRIVIIRRPVMPLVNASDVSVSLLPLISAKYVRSTVPGVALASK
jgi:hypothetical protein